MAAYSCRIIFVHAESITDTLDNRVKISLKTCLWSASINREFTLHTLVVCTGMFRDVFSTMNLETSCRIIHRWAGDVCTFLQNLLGSSWLIGDMTTGVMLLTLSVEIYCVAVHIHGPLGGTAQLAGDPTVLPLCATITANFKLWIDELDNFCASGSKEQKTEGWTLSLPRAAVLHWLVKLFRTKRQKVFHEDSGHFGGKRCCRSLPADYSPGHWLESSQVKEHNFSGRDQPREKAHTLICLWWIWIFIFPTQCHATEFMYTVYKMYQSGTQRQRTVFFSCTCCCVTYHVCVWGCDC